MEFVTKHADLIKGDREALSDLSPEEANIVASLEAESCGDRKARCGQSTEDQSPLAFFMMF